MSTSDKQYFLIINPTASSGRAKNRYKIIINALQKQKINFDYALTQRPKDAVKLAQAARNKNYPFVVAVGGDGTIAEVITGLLSNNSTGNIPKLGVLHIGTSPDFNKYHNIPVDISAAIQTLLKAKTKSIDIGKITYQETCPGNSRQTIAYFGSNVNIGLGPMIASKANSRFRKYLGDTCGTLLAVLCSLIGFNKFSLNIEIDGLKTKLRDMVNLTIGKDPYLASGMRVFNAISPDDGKLFCLSISLTSWAKILTSLYKLYLGNFLQYQGARISYAKEIKIDYCKAYPKIEFDGDVQGELPAEISILPKALEVITR
jgi:YegS/Rv2252/BmrU family lipid kinase